MIESPKTWIFHRLKVRNGGKRKYIMHNMSGSMYLHSVLVIMVQSVAFTLFERNIAMKYRISRNMTKQKSKSKVSEHNISSSINIILNNMMEFSKFSK